MFQLVTVLSLFFIVIDADLLTRTRNKGATLKPISACCDIPEIGDSKPLEECSNPKPPGPCNDVQCVFEKSGFLSGNNTLDNTAYTTHLRQWAEKNEAWTSAVNKAITDCVNTELRQYLDYPCKAYDVFTCTGIAMVKKCPDTAWQC
uniref:Setae polypeptide n=1 Tax=Ochrogaster lunifer TaxID=319761 RepID=A0AA49ETN6_OCHLU|nr:setae polypeptide [Ochrogaster lunifer]